MIEVVLHCSDSGWGNAATIEKWHRERGFGCATTGLAIGYHLVILNGRIAPSHYNARFDGRIETGRPIGVNGAHAIGHNDKVGICLIGKSGQFSAAQVRSLIHGIRELSMEHTGVIVTQHSDHDERKPFCAGFTEIEMRRFNSL